MQFAIGAGQALRPDQVGAVVIAAGGALGKTVADPSAFAPRLFRERGEGGPVVGRLRHPLDFGPRRETIAAREKLRQDEKVGFERRDQLGGAGDIALDAAEAGLELEQGGAHGAKTGDRKSGAGWRRVPVPIFALPAAGGRDDAVVAQVLHALAAMVEVMA